MLEEKLHGQKFHEHIEIIKQYQHHKIQLMNYFTHLGKLKVLNQIFGLKETIQQEELKEYLDQRLKKLNIKLEKVDIQLVSLLQQRQT